MALKNQVSNVYGVGLHNVGSYQVSGQPYLSGSDTSIVTGSVVDGHYSFPYVSKSLIIRNSSTGSHAMVSFAPILNRETSSYGFTNGASGSGNWLYLPATSSMELNVKASQVFISPIRDDAVSASVYAELTNIPTRRLYSFDGLEGITTFSASVSTAPILKNQVPNVYSVGLQNMGSYQVAGRPFITGSNIRSAENIIGVNVETSVAFPKTTKSLTVWNHSKIAVSKLRVTFASTGSMTNYPANGCYYELARGENVTLNLKCKKVYLSAVGGDVYWKLYASLTNIPRERMYDLTGSGISE